MDFQMLNMLFRCAKEYNHKKIKSCGLSDTESLICSYVYQHEACSQDDVVQSLRIDKTTAAKAMLTLEEKGYITRETDPKDRRKKALRITEHGIEGCSEIINLHDRWLKEVMSTLSDSEQEQFEHYCVRLLTKAENMITEQRKTNDTDRRNSK